MAFVDITPQLIKKAAHDWARTLELRQSCHCLFLDFSKAFDTVPHSRLLLKLESLGITGDLLNWIKAFLTTQSQRVVINGCHSSWLPVISAVPQGSILGQLLFILYVNDIKTVISHSYLNRRKLPVLVIVSCCSGILGGSMSGPRLGCCD